MSGGSLNYLYCADTNDLINRISDLKEVERELISLEYADVAKDVRRLIEYCLTAQNRIDVLFEQLEDVFHSVEWWKSSDIGLDDLKRHLEQYRNGGDTNDS